MSAEVDIQAVPDEFPVATHPHMGGDMLATHDIEALRQMCPMMGRLSVEQVGQFLEMQARRQELAQSTTPHEARTLEAPRNEVEPAQTIAVERSTEEPDLFTRTLQERLSHDHEATQIAEPANNSDIETRQYLVASAPITEQKPAPKTVRATDIAEPVFSAVPLQAKAKDILDQDVIEDPVLQPSTVEETEPRLIRPDPKEHVAVQQLLVMPEATEVAATMRRTLEEMPSSSVKSEPLEVRLEVVSERLLAEPLEVQQIASEIQELLKSDDDAAEATLTGLINIQELANELVAESSDQVLELTVALETLITEVLNDINIETTPELIRLIVELANEQQLVTVLSEPDTHSPSIQELSKKLGTDEFLMTLQQGLQSIQHTGSTLFWVGRSVLTAFAKTSA